MTNVFLEANYLTSEQTIIPISLALVSENNSYCYFEFNYNTFVSELDTNIINNLLILNQNNILNTIEYGIIRNDINSTEIINNSDFKRDVTIDIILFLEKYNDVKIVSNDASYS